MSPAAPLARTDNLTAMLRLVGLFRRTFADLLAREPWVVSSGVKPSTYGLLSVVDRRQPVSQREVCDALGTHASDMVDIVDGADARGGSNGGVIPPIAAATSSPSPPTAATPSLATTNSRPSPRPRCSPRSAKPSAGTSWRS